jgi:DNA-binding transcriptional LysR family regulator
MDRLRAMTIFVAVSEAGSMSAAARELGEPLTNVSRSLSQLEAYLGCTLLDRTTRRMALTSAGSDYLETCKRVIEAIDGVERRIVGQTTDLSGDLAVTAPVQFGRIHVLPLIAEFLAAYPRINVRLLLIDRVVDLLEEEIDVALRIGELPDSAMLGKRVNTLRLVTCASPAYLDRRGTPGAPAALVQHDCVTFAGLPGGLRWLFKSRRNGRKSVRVRSRLAVNSADAAVSAAVSGVGITRVLSYQAQAELQDGRLLPILERFEDTPIPVHLVYRPTRSTNPRLRSFVDFAAEKLRALRAWDRG